MRREPSPLAQSLAAKFAVVSLNTSQGTASPQSLSEPRRRQRLRSFPTPPASQAGEQPGSRKRLLERREQSASAATPGIAEGITEGILTPCPGAGRAEGVSVRGSCAAPAPRAPRRPFCSVRRAARRPGSCAEGPGGAGGEGGRRRAMS